MKVRKIRLGLSLVVAGVTVPVMALAQAAAPAAEPAPAPPAAPPGPPPSAPQATTPSTPPAPVTAPTPEATPGPSEAPATSQPKQQQEAPAAAAPAETPPPAATISGYVDGAYHADLSNYKYNQLVPLRSYDAHGANSFLLHSAHVGIGHSFTPEVSVFVSLDFGVDAAVDNALYAPVAPAGSIGSVPSPLGPVGTPIDFREAYAKYAPGDLTIVAGKFVTLNGIEVVDGPLNPTVTRGFLFGLAEPVTHTGIKANYALAGGKAHIGAGIVNGWDNVYDTNNQKTILFNADVYPSDTFHAQLSGSWGAEQPDNDKNHRTTIDLTGAAIFDALTLNFQGLIGFESFPSSGPSVLPGPIPDNKDLWFGLGVQPVYAMGDFTLGGRLEYFYDKHGTRPFLAGNGVAADKESFLNFTITPGYMFSKSFTMRAEYRIDAVLGAKDFATGSDNKKILNGKSTQSTIALQAFYTF